jgi:hypothetical protein
MLHKINYWKNIKYVALNSSISMVGAKGKGFFEALGFQLLAFKGINLWIILIVTSHALNLR